MQLNYRGPDLSDDSTLLQGYLPISLTSISLCSILERVCVQRYGFVGWLSSFEVIMACASMKSPWSKQQPSTCLVNPGEPSLTSYGHGSLKTIIMTADIHLICWVQLLARCMKWAKWNLLFDQAESIIEFLPWYNSTACLCFPGSFFSLFFFSFLVLFAHHPVISEWRLRKCSYFSSINLHDLFHFLLWLAHVFHRRSRCDIDWCLFLNGFKEINRWSSSPVTE